MLQIYKASAGSGKTYTLAREYIRMLLQGSAQDARAHTHILAVTFTKKATAEMKERILKELFLLSTNTRQSGYFETFTQDLHLNEEQLRERAKERLFLLLQDYSHFAVSTIDGFFQQIVRSFARELGLAAMYNLTLDSQSVIEEAVDDLIFAINNRPHEEGTLHTWINNFALENIRDGKSWNPKQDMLAISTHLLTERLQAQLHAIRPLLTDKDFLTSYKNELQSIVDNYQASDLARKRKLTEEQQALRRSSFTAEAILAHMNSLGLLSDVAEQIHQTNIRKQRLPIADINLLLHNVIDGSETPFIYEKIGTRLQHFMIDEFQDTSSLQWDNLRPLVSEANDNGHANLVVGDVKQSIYRWRNSDWRLLENVHTQVHPSTEPAMDTNYRSSHVIVDTNNDIFQRYSDWVANTLDHQFSELGNYGESVRHAYSTLRQRAKHQELGGRCRFQFLPSDSEENAVEWGLEKMLEAIANVQARGGKLGQIAVLVRDGKKAQLVTSQLLNAGYQVESAEGLLVMSHPAVTVLTCLLTLSIREDDDMARSHLRLTYAEHLYDDPQQAIEMAMSTEPLFSQEQQQAIQHAGTLPLYEQVLSLIETLRLHEWNQADAYLTTYIDLVYQYCENQIADTASWLTYWQKQQVKASIPSSSGEDAIRVMTIHKSKGLEFDVVIVPLLDWPYAIGQMDSRKLLWCTPKEAPFNRLPLVPVKCTQSLSKTYFCQEYATEVRDLMIDNMNLTYVAFTRPRMELYAFGQQPKITKDGKPSIKNIEHLLATLLESQLNEEGIYEQGERLSLSTSEEHEGSTSPRSTTYISVPIGDRLHLSTNKRHEEDLSTRELGTIMHEWLGRMDSKEDALKQLDDMRREGWVRDCQVETMKEELGKIWQLVDPYHWFDKGLRVLREQDILCIDGKTQRPDRIVISGQRAQIIDWKFGKEHKRTYHEQVRNYMTLLDKMGYQTEGYLVYVQQAKIEKIQ